MVILQIACQLAEMLDEDARVIAVWKQRDKWNVVQQTIKRVTSVTDP